MLNVFIQARMSSKRFPGKVLAPINGKPLILYLLESLERVSGISKKVVLTSEDLSDDPLVAYLESEGIDVFRGNLIDVFDRFRAALKRYPCKAFIRICADSPLLHPHILQQIVTTYNSYKKEFDLFTNVFPRSLPKGQSVELINCESFEKISHLNLTEAQKEHITSYFYECSERFKIISFISPTDYSKLSHCIDEVSDINNFNQNKRNKFLGNTKLEIKV